MHPKCDTKCYKDSKIQEKVVLLTGLKRHFFNDAFPTHPPEEARYPAVSFMAPSAPITKTVT